MANRCQLPPQGWWCSRTPGHEGPCAARPFTGPEGWASPTLGNAYFAIEKLREQVAQPVESGIDEALRAALDAIEVADCELMGVAS